MTINNKIQSENPIEKIIELLLQPIIPESENENNHRDHTTYLQAHQQIQSSVLSNYNVTNGNSSIDLTDQNILDNLIDYKKSIQTQFDQIQIQYSNSNETVQKLIQRSQQEAENLKPTSENLNQEFKQFEEQIQNFYQDHYQNPSKEIDEHQGSSNNPHQATASSSSSNLLLGSISEELRWLKELGRIKLWFQILSDFHLRTNQLLSNQSSFKSNSVASTNRFDSLAMEICQIIVTYQDLFTQCQSSSLSPNIHFNLFNYVYQIIQNSINSIIQFLSNHLSQILEDSIDWPKPSRSPLDFTSSNTNQIVNSFKVAVNFQSILMSKPGLVSFDEDAGEEKERQIINVSNLNERSILLKAILDPIILRFRFHFDGARPTNRLDRPEWYLNHILDRITEHEAFLKTDVQQLFRLSGEGSIEVFSEFTKQLIKLVERKLRRSVPQILEMKPILAHTIESTIRFDAAIKQTGFLTTEIGSKPLLSQSTSQWLGTADVILSNPDWFRAWFEAEKGFVDDMYLEIISSNDTWEINEEDIRPIEMKLLGTNSSIRIQELIEQIKEKYFKLPKLIYQIDFLIHLQIPTLENYAQRIQGILDGFDKNVTRFASVVGAADSRRSKIYIGYAGLERLVKVFISSNWILKNLQSWNDDLFYAELYENLKRDKKSFGKMTAQVDKLINSIDSIAGLDVNIFSPLVKRFEELSSRAETWIVRQVVQEISSELKPYLLKRWDIEPPNDPDKSEKEMEDEMELSDEIIKPISIWKSRISYLTRTIKPMPKLNKLIKTISKEIESKFISKIILDPFTIRSISLLGARQLQFDLLYGWLNFHLDLQDQNLTQSTSTHIHHHHHHQTKRIKLDKYFNKLLDGCKLLSFPSSSSSSIKPGSKTLQFNDLVQLCFNQQDEEVLDHPLDLNDQLITGKEIKFKQQLAHFVNVSSLSKAECQAFLKRRPECWKS